MLDEIINDLQCKVFAVKTLFGSYIADTSVPLEQRWDAFVKAPSYLKNHEHWYCDFTIDGNTICWYEDFNVDRYQTAKLTDIVECMLEHDEDFYTVEGIKAFKEKILKENLGSFRNDW